ANCNDNNPCTNDSCVPGTGCVNANNTSACTDNNPCTLGDTCSGGACVPGSAPMPAPVQVCNNNQLFTPDVGATMLYPSPVTLSGQPSYICSTTVDLLGITHSRPDDIDALLTRPDGTPKALIMSDVGGTTAVSGLNLTLADA